MNRPLDKHRSQRFASCVVVIYRWTREECQRGDRYNSHYVIDASGGFPDIVMRHHPWPDVCLMGAFTQTRGGNVVYLDQCTAHMDFMERDYLHNILLERQ